MGILERWGALYTQAVQLSEEIERLPAECPCGNADAHLESRCPCCAGHAAKGLHLGQSCKELLADLQADARIFCADFARVVAPAGEVEPPERREIRRDVVLAAGDLEQLLRALERLDEAVVGFRRSCTLSGMRRVKEHGATLRAHCDRLDRDLSAAGEVTPPPQDPAPRAEPASAPGAPSRNGPG